MTVNMSSAWWSEQDRVPFPYEHTDSQHPYHNERLHAVEGKCMLQEGILRSDSEESLAKHMNQDDSM